jgi:DNA replication initiation complex subunit (GINS family)
MPKADSGSKNSDRFDPLSTPEGSVNNMASEDATVKVVMNAMKPMLDLLKSSIVASQQAAVIQLNGSFLQQILQLNETISEYTTRVITLEEKIAASQKEMKEIKAVPKPTYTAVAGHNLPDKPSAQNTTSNPVNNQSTSKGHQRKAKKERLTQAKYLVMFTTLA